MFRFFALFALLTFGLHAQTFWQGDSGGFHITWTDSNLEAQPAFDAKVGAEGKWKEIQRRADPKEPTSAEFSYRLLSVVGTILSTENGAEGSGGGAAHPSAFTTFVALDLKMNRPARLPDLFPAAVLYTALMNDSIVKTALADKKPKSFEELTDALKDATYTTDNCGYVFQTDFANFAFYDYRPGFVDVRISMPYAAEVCRGSYIQLGLELPVSDPVLKAALAGAKSGRHGVLMKAMERRVDKDTSTTFTFTQEQKE